MRRKRTGGKNSAYRREKAIMTASVVLVLAAMTVTGISVYRNHQKSQEEEQHIVDFSKLEEETQSPAMIKLSNITPITVDSINNMPTYTKYILYDFSICCIEHTPFLQNI